MIIKASSQVRDGSILVDEAGRRACKVMESIGPVASPYLSAQPLTDRVERIVGTKLFVSERFEQEERRTRFGKKKGGKRYGQAVPGKRPRSR